MKRSPADWWQRPWPVTPEGTPAGQDEPLRAQLMSAEQMALHGKHLAASHVLSKSTGPDRLLARLRSNERVLLDLGKRLAAVTDTERRFSPAAEWLLDNFYLIEEEIQTARRHLPRGYSRELPPLSEDPVNGAGAGLPRVYHLALEIVAHGDGHVSRSTLSRFIAAYQSGQPLLLGELWAIPIMLRLALIENLRRVAVRVAIAYDDREMAGVWADSMLEVAENAPSDLILVVADMARSAPSMTNAFVAEFTRRVQGQGASLVLPLTWFELRLAESGRTIQQLVHMEGQQQAANQVSVSNSIGSLRLLGTMDWREFVETLSGVEQTLRDDPSGVYAHMDFGTRDRYRHVVEAIARMSDASETDVARHAVALCTAATASGERPAHVGEVLIGARRSDLERAVEARIPRWLALARAARARAVPLYAAALFVVTLLIAAWPLAQMPVQLELPPWGQVLLVLTLVTLGSQLAVSLVNWLVTLFVTPQRLPRMDYSFGIASSSRTLVVVPTMLGNAHGVEALVEALEVRFLANRDPNLHFGLLTDLHDATTEHLPTDAALVELAAARIEALNAKYRLAGDVPGSNPFYLFHRPRRWNARERVWMGYERKRGKLGDLNALLRGHTRDGPNERFARVVGETLWLSAVRYVITLDTDTELPRGAAAQLVAAMAHPLNTPRFGSGPRTDVVVEGYGILQPRMAASLPSTHRSLYARMNGGEPGIDPYTRAVSDVYQDLFGEGSFIGKGIYDVDAFERALGNRLPENRILSHDLLEGCYARCGLLSDVQLIEGAPTRYSADVARRYRWIRGDWQLTGWLRRRLHALPGAPPNPLSALSHAKIFDNLRRSLVPLGSVLLLLAGWWLLPEPGWWTLFTVAVVALVPLATHAAGWLRDPLERLFREENSFVTGAAGQPALRLLLQGLHTLACLPYEAAYSAGAIARTLWRVLLSKRRLLEWRPSADVSVDTEPGTLADLLRSTRTLVLGPVLAIACAAGLALQRPEALAWAAPVLLLWLGSPLLVWWIDGPPTRRRVELTGAQRVFLRRLARRTWGFFELHVTAADHHLPPDNVQEHPVPRVAYRTSPTNMGFSLLASLAARGFGYLGTAQLVERLDAALTTMEGMARYRGHFYNWYDTRTLEPLRPHYVSTVDSGNLAAQLLTLRSGLLALADEPILPSTWQDGVHDCFGVMTEALQATPPASGATVPAAVARFGELLKSHRARPPVTVAEWKAMLDALEAGAASIVAALGVPLEPAGGAADEDPIVEEEGVAWAQLLWKQCRAGCDAARALPSDGVPTAAESAGLPSPSQLATRAGDRALLDKLEALAARAGDMTNAEHGFLYDRTRHLMTIGYNVDERRADAGYYDLLASEARLGVFVAIAQGHVEQESWFALGRLLRPAAGAPVLVSWSGSMFEYLMPMLLMPSYENTLLHQTCHGAVRRQIEYGRQQGVPWGISESGYNATDAALNYQYRAFGVPGLGLKRGLADDLVVTPHASMMALMVAPEEACTNLQQLAAAGAAGRHGLYEAIDYTASRLPRGQKSAIVRSFMAHHQGMGLLALAYVLQGRPMQRYFEADPSLQATLLLLQERVPRVATIQPDIGERAVARTGTATAAAPIRVVGLDAAAPEVQLLSNGRYHVMVSHSGGGYSRWNEFAVTRWHEDTTSDAWGSFIYLRDVDSGEIWSTAHQPTGTRPAHYEAIFAEGRAEFRRQDGGIETHTEISVSPEDDVELRRVRISNGSATQRTVEVTSYSEVVLASAISDALHPAFSKLFVQTEILENPAAILCTRRARSPDEAPPWMFQLMAVHGQRLTSGIASLASAITHETDRAQFIGRGNDLAAPLAMRSAGPLSNRSGAVLDPVAASRCAFTLEPDQSVIVDIVIGAGANRAHCVGLAEKYSDRQLAGRVFELAWTHSQVVLRQLNASEADAQLYARIASAVIYTQPRWRADSALLTHNRRGQSGLWGYGISGDLPIVLLQIGSADNVELARQLVQAHAWWRLKGLAVDLVIWNEERDIYRHRLQEQITGLIAAGVEARFIDRPGGIFVRHVEQIAHEDRILLQAVARAVFSDSRGSLAEQVNRGAARALRPARFVPSRTPEQRDENIGKFNRARARRPVLASDNGIGGFAPDGSEYVIAPPAGDRPPAPWVNVLANPRFGCVISEAGSAYTWCENAHELRLTPWNNDPVTDATGEAIYLRDEEGGEVWSPTSLPCMPRDTTARAFVARHGFGYSVFEHSAHGIRAELTVFVDVEEAVKFSVLRLTNESGRPRQLSATGYVEWVLGDLRSKSMPHIVTEVAADGALYARNPYSNDYGDWIGFFDVDPARRETGSFTCDRAEFVGRNGSLRRPAALERTRLGGHVGPALDPCAAIQVRLALAHGQSEEVVFRLGMGRSTQEAGELVERFRGASGAKEALARVRKQWQAILGAVQVRTPERALDVLVNGWLLYQTVACRLWARSGFYQSGGAFGFRDQLQDSMALVHSQPRLLRAQLLLCASRQFIEGDVQHWWHPPQGRGVRTRISDDYLWLPLALARYVEATGDWAVLDEVVPYLEGRPVNPPDDSYYDLPVPSGTSASLYQHASLALWHGLRFGAHGLPLMGTGDWNDGMNLVGHAGRGQSVWLGFFLCEVLARFGALAQQRGDQDTASRCEGERERLRSRLEDHGWDGAWYRRAYFDDGTPLGSAGNIECQIDSIAQSWSVLSGVAAPDRARQAMESMYTRLVTPDEKVARLLDPPFDRMKPSPGYIAGYLPGVRENGGQYNHAAIWAAMACASLGERERAWSLLEIINPAYRTSTPAGVKRYKVEPYVIAADVYTVAPHTGRGGWSWYTGSAGWLYRLIVESLLGVRLETTADGARLVIAPCLPAEWPGYTLAYRYGRSLYQIEVVQDGVRAELVEVRVDGETLDARWVPLTDDGRQHTVVVRLGERQAA